MFDPSVKAEGTLTAVPEVAMEQIPQFVSVVKSALAAAPSIAEVAANSVRVIPGTKTFTTITDALNSITDAKLQKQYVVQVGPGTYNEVVVCKPWVFIQGAGSDQTTVTAPASTEQWNKGTVRGASNSAVQNMTIISIGHNWGDWAAAVSADAAQNFDVENCNLQAIDQTGDNGSNLVTVAVDYSAFGGGSQVNVAYCTVSANGGAAPIGVCAFSRSFVQITDSKINSTSAGCAAAMQSTMNLYNCYVDAPMALHLADGSASMTARDCQIVGAVDPGVVVIND